MTQPDCWFYYSEDEGWYYAPLGRYEPQGPFGTWAECLEDWLS